MGVAQSRKRARAKGRGGGQGPARTTLGPVLLVAVDEQEAGALGAEGQQHALQQGRDEDDTQQQGPQVLVAHDGVQAEHLRGAGMEEDAPGTPALAPAPGPTLPGGLCMLWGGAAGKARLSFSEPQFPHLSHGERGTYLTAQVGRQMAWLQMWQASHRVWGLWGKGKPSGEKVVYI